MSRAARLHVQIVTPSVPDVVTGNVQTATRYARILRRLGHRVTVTAAYQHEAPDVLIALHARRSYPSIRRFAARHSTRPLVVVLTGTDLYRDIHTRAQAQESLALATRLVLLQRAGLAELPVALRPKTRVIYQSAAPVHAQPRPTTYFRVVVVGHLRPEKDPLRTARAARLLPTASRIRVVQVGAALDPAQEARVQQEVARNPRLRWLGALPHARTRRLIAGSHLLALTSRMEGSANVLGEALAQSEPTPVVASRISGLIGTLGEDYPGYFALGDTRALAALLWRAESDPTFYAALTTYCAAAAPLVAPAREHAAWQDLLAELTPRGSTEG